jgi:hypothetical protein
MPTSGFTVVNNASPGDWIAPRLHGRFGAVTLAVPSGFAAYVRICHPARDSYGRIVKWSEVAQATGRTAHALMQWHALVGSPDSDKFKGSLWDGEAPNRGNLALPQFKELCDLLGWYTTDASRCFVGLWIGWAWIEGAGSAIIRMRRGADRVEDSPELVASAFSVEELNRARLRLPDRDYVLLAGPLLGATRIRDTGCPELSKSQSPNLFWPTDRAWFVASEIDFDSTLVGGSVELAQSILAVPGLDAWPVDPDDSLAFDADKINHVKGELS